jgi:hypothetical protein
MFVSRTFQANLYTEKCKEDTKMFNTKNYQTRHLSKTWQLALKRREIEKNNFRATGDLKKAKAFVKMFENFRFHIDFVDFVQTVEHIVFPADSLTIPLLFLVNQRLTDF